MGRGPSYPYVDLEGAIGYARKVYDYAKRGSAPVESVVKEGFKFSPTSSGGQKVIAALRSFGLVEDAPGTNGKALKLSARAIRILLDDQDSAERKEEIKKAALAPKWYEYCWSKWGRDMPAAMRSNLLIEHGFVESTVDGFLEDYQKSIAFGGLLEEGEGSEVNKDRFKVGSWVQWERPGGILGLPEAKRITGFSPNRDFIFVEDTGGTGIPLDEAIASEPPENFTDLSSQGGAFLATITAKGITKMQTDVITIGGNSITIQIQWPTEITQDAYDDLVDYLGIFTKRAKRAIKAAPSDPLRPAVVTTNEGVS
jgi:hypothetical protein